MKPNRKNPLVSRYVRHFAAVSVVFALASAAAPLASAATVYWDANAATAGSGNLGGTWDAGTNWSTDSTGSIATQAWANNDSVVIAAGTDGVGGFTITLAGTVATPSILVEEAGAKTISGGTITLGGGTLDTAAAGSGNVFTVSSVLAGTGGLSITANGDASDGGGGGGGVGGALLLSGANTFTGDVTINGGVIRSNSSFGDAGNKIILNAGGIVDSNLNTNFSRNIEIPATKTGVYRTYGGVTTGQISGAITGSGTLKHTDGGTLSLTGNGSAFNGTINNVRGNLTLTSLNWSGTSFINQDGGNLNIPTAGTTSIKDLTNDRDVVISTGARLNVVTGNITASAGAAAQSFWISGAGKLTSQSGVLTLDWPVSYNTAGDQAVRIIVEDYDGSTPLQLVKNGIGGVA